MEQNMNNSNAYQRKDRQVSPETRQKISAALKNHPKTDIHKQHISMGQKAAWAKIPVRYDDGQTGYVENGIIV